MTPEQRAHVVLAPLRLWGVLLLLVAATLGYAYLPGGPFKTEASLAIALAKAVLIALLFMQLKGAAWLVRLAAMAGVTWLSLLFLIAFADYLTR